MGGHERTVQQMITNSTGTQAITVSSDMAQVNTSSLTSSNEFRFGA